MLSRSVIPLAIALLLTGCGDDSPFLEATPDPLLELKRAHVREIATTLHYAFERFEVRDFDGCIAGCRSILAREPEYWVAQDLAEDAGILKCREEKSREEWYAFAMAKVHEWKKLFGDEEDDLIPYQNSLTYPHLPRPSLKARVLSVAHIHKLEHQWAPDVGKQLASELDAEYPNLLVFGDWGMQCVTLISLDDTPFTPEFIEKVDRRIRELDRPTPNGERLPANGLRCTPNGQRPTADVTENG